MHDLFQCKNDVNITIEYLLDRPADEKKELQKEFEKYHQMKQKEIRENASNRQKIMSRHEYKQVLPMYDEKGKPLGHPIEGKKTKANVFITINPEMGGGTVKRRYRDGVVVTNRGEKKIDVKPKEEYDGGSRGKVKLKGKRGPGWVSG